MKELKSLVAMAKFYFYFGFSFFGYGFFAWNLFQSFEPVLAVSQ